MPHFQGQQSIGCPRSTFAQNWTAVVIRARLFRSLSMGPILVLDTPYRKD